VLCWQALAKASIRNDYLGSKSHAIFPTSFSWFAPEIVSEARVCLAKGEHGLSCFRAAFMTVGHNVRIRLS
jgi:hypothetical protein